VGKVDNNNRGHDNRATVRGLDSSDERNRVYKIRLFIGNEQLK
jgi:hypothetical protein